MPNTAVYGPLSGSNAQGYQELQLASDRWFVAYQGNRSTSPDWIEAAWNTRSAQLCKDAGADRFVELRYPFEAVLQGEALNVKPPRAGYRAVPVAGRVYVPTYSYVPAAPIYVDGPAKLGSVLCVKSGVVLKDAQRGMSVTEALAKAGELNMMGAGSAAGDMAATGSKPAKPAGPPSYSRGTRNPPVAP